MLSVLIPVYNYDCTELVQSIASQSHDYGIDYEIICRDDFLENDATTISNQKINSISNCSYQVNTEQLGRAKNRNYLASIAKYDWILFIDCDMLPVNTTFIKNYVEALKKGKFCAFYGGVAYQKKQLKDDNALRYYYGIEREAISLETRTKRPYKNSLTSNFLIQKRQFSFIKYNESISGYGYEDLVLIHNLKKKNIKIEQLDNPSYHMQLETSALFLEKCQQAMENLKRIEDLGLITHNHTRIQLAYQALDHFYMLKLFVFTTRLFRKPIQRNLLSLQPNIKFLDIFKLSYFCQLKLK